MGMFDSLFGAPQMSPKQKALTDRLIARNEKDLKSAEAEIARYSKEIKRGSADPQADRYLLRQAQSAAMIARANLRDLRR